MDKWLSKLERRFGRYAIHNLMYYIIILYALGFVLNLLNRDFYYQFLSLDAAAILHGQIWRIVTFIIQPPSDSLIFIIFMLHLYYMIGQQLEAAWGAFRFNLYFFSGMFFHVIAALFIYLVTGLSIPMGSHYLNMSLFFVFAALFPDVQFMLYMIIPVKVKWLAWVDAAFFLWQVLNSMMMGLWLYAVLPLVAVLNFFIFFWPDFRYLFAKTKRRRSAQTINFKKAQKELRQRRGYLHKCAVCGVTDQDDPNMEFRYCSKCTGYHCYCQDHIFNHMHHTE